MNHLMNTVFSQQSSDNINNVFKTEMVVAKIVVNQTPWITSLIYLPFQHLDQTPHITTFMHLPFQLLD